MIFGDPLVLKQRRYPINNPIHCAGGDAENEDGSCNGEHLNADAQNLSLCLELDCRRYHRVGEARYGHKRAAARDLCIFFVEVQSSKEGGKPDECDRHERF